MNLITFTLAMFSIFAFSLGALDMGVIFAMATGVAAMKNGA